MPRVKIAVPDRTPQPYRFNLDHKIVKIGRAPDCDIIIDEPSVSGHHATMKRVSGGYILQDEGSTNGITLDDKPMEIIDLRNGDDVKVGDAAFDYELSDDEQDQLDLEDFKSLERKKIQLPTAGSSDVDDDLPPLPKKQKKKPVRKSKPQPATGATSGPVRPVPNPALAPAASTENSFIVSLAVFLLGVLAFLAGINKSYVDAEEEAGRTNVSLVKDIKNGKTLPDNVSTTEE